MKNIFSASLFILVSFLFASCTTYTTNLNTMEKLENVKVEDIREGKVCSNNLFGGFKLPYIGDTAIRLSGDESVMAAIKKINATKIYAIDLSTVHYVFYSKRCTLVFGQ